MSDLMSGLWVCVSRMRAAEDFFGRPLHETNVLLRQIHALSDPVPEWLRGAQRLQDLPRYARIGEKVEHERIALPGVKLPGVAQRVAWVVENLNGGWRVQHTTRPAFYFLDLRDAVYYRLRWSHEQGG